MGNQHDVDNTVTAARAAFRGWGSSRLDERRAKRVARQLNAGMIQINGVSPAPGTPFGGMKQSGIGREGGYWGLEDYLEVKAISGWQ